MFPMLDPSTARLRGGRSDCEHDLPASLAVRGRVDYEFPCTRCGGVVIVDVDPAFRRAEDLAFAQVPDSFTPYLAEQLSAEGV